MKYQRGTPSGRRDKGIRTFDFAAKTQFLWMFKDGHLMTKPVRSADSCDQLLHEWGWGRGRVPSFNVFFAFTAYIGTKEEYKNKRLFIAQRVCIYYSINGQRTHWNLFIILLYFLTWETPHQRTQLIYFLQKKNNCLLSSIAFFLFQNKQKLNCKNIKVSNAK